MSQVVGLPNNSYKPIANTRGFAPGFVKYKNGYTRLAAASDNVYQFLAHGLWFSPGTPASSTTKTGRHGIAEILLKVALTTKDQSMIHVGDISRMIYVRYISRRSSCFFISLFLNISSLYVCLLGCCLLFLLHIIGI